MTALRLLAAGLAMACSANVAVAEEVDIGTITCAQVMQSNEQEIAMIIAWVDGFIGGTANDTRFVDTRLDENMKSVAEYCASNPDTGFLSAYKAAEGER